MRGVNFAVATGSECRLRLRGQSCGGDGWRVCGNVETGQEGPTAVAVAGRLPPA
jgi:hypothetical protein